jgi:exopolysaccharide biosynthesis protein
MTKRNTLIVSIGLMVVVVLGGLLYVLVDHYLAEDSQAATVVSTQAGSTGSETDSDETTDATSPEDSSSDDTVSEDASTEDTSAPDASEDTTSTSYESVDDEGGGYTATDTSYVSDTTSITITQVVTGEGDDTITYYVADVLLTPGTDLRAGLAGDGRDTADTSDIARDYNAILAINGDYFGARDDGIIIRNGEVYRDEGVRTGLAIYTDGHMEVYDETETSAEELLENGVWNTYSFGPALLVDGEIPDNVDTYEVEDNPEHPIQGRDPRTAIGIIDENHFVFVVVDGRDEGYSKGVTLEEFAQIMQDLGCTTAYNLDGGGSSTMYFMGELVNHPSGKSGERDVSDILFVG